MAAGQNNLYLFPFSGELYGAVALKTEFTLEVSLRGRQRNSENRTPAKAGAGGCN